MPNRVNQSHVYLSAIALAIFKAKWLIKILAIRHWRTGKPWRKDMWCIPQINENLLPTDDVKITCYNTG
jgi:hypothetical protein